MQNFKFYIQRHRFVEIMDRDIVDTYNKLTRNYRGNALSLSKTSFVTGVNEISISFPIPKIITKDHLYYIFTNSVRYIKIDTFVSLYKTQDNLMTLQTYCWDIGLANQYVNIIQVYLNDYRIKEAKKLALTEIQKHTCNDVAGLVNGFM